MKSPLLKNSFNINLFIPILFDQIIALLYLLTSKNMVFGKCSLTFLKDDSVSALLFPGTEITTSIQVIHPFGAV